MEADRYYCNNVHTDCPMLKNTVTIFLAFLWCAPAFTQMEIDGEVLYGHEWIQYDQDYLKISISEDGIYRISASQLTAGGVDINQIRGVDFQLWHKGKQVPLLVSNEGPIGVGDYILFYGAQNRGELDQYLYANPSENHLNPHYSLFNDESAYFLSWSSDNQAAQQYILKENQGELPTDTLQDYRYTHRQVFTDNLARSFEVDEPSGQVLLRSDLDVHTGYARRFSDLELQLPIQDFSDNGPPSHLYFKLLTDRNNHQLQIQINGELEASATPDFFELLEWNFNLPAAEMEGSHLSLSIRGMLGEFDRYFLPFVEMTYSRKPLFLEDKPLAMHLESMPPRTLKIPVSDPEGSLFYLFDNRTLEYHTAEVKNGKLTFGLSQAETEGKVVVFSRPKHSSEVEALKTTAFLNLGELEPINYVIISHPDLYEDESGNNWVEEYANYRSTPQGGGFNVLTANINELYDQFAYGLDRHPLSIKNFAFYAREYFDDLQFIFIIGKGRPFNAVRTTEQLNLPERQTFFVPTFGSPGSDVLLVAEAGKAEPIVPIGRIAASVPNQIRIYLEKIMEYERPQSQEQTIESKVWQKQVMHLVGGRPDDSERLKVHMSNLEELIQSTDMGAGVETFVKTSSDPVEPLVSEAIFNRINDGLSIMTFMGHSSPTSLDFNINNPLRYNNFSRMPLLIALGCRTGDFNRDDLSLGEEFCFYEQKGFIGSIASTSLSYSDQLYRITREMYINLGTKLHGRSIGEALKASIASRQNQHFRMSQQFLLHGDPAVRLPSFDGPDITPDANSATVDPVVVNATDRTFEFSFDIVNLGLNKRDSFALRINRELPNGELIEAVVDSLLIPPFRKKVTYSFPVLGDSAVGLNRMFVELDIHDQLDERPLPQAEQNNSFSFAGGESGFAFQVVNNSARAVYPNDFGIVGGPDFSYRAYTNQLPIPDQQYIIEIDTISDFNSPFKVTERTNSRGGSIEFKPALNYQHNKVYYWRVGPEMQNPDLGPQWDQRSFIFLEGEGPGWNQSHFGQWKVNRFDSMEMRLGLGHPDLAKEQLDVRFQNYTKDDPLNSYGFFVGAQPIGSVRNAWDRIDEGIVVAYIDTLIFTLVPNPSGGIHGSVNPGGEIRAFPYLTDSEQSRRDLMFFIDSIIPENSSVYVWTVLKNQESDLSVEEWEADTSIYSDNLFTLMEKYGAKRFRELKEENTGLYAFTFLKSRNGSGVPLSEDIDIDLQSGAFNEALVPRRIPAGRMTSIPVGNSLNWNRMEWGVGTPDSPLDSFSFSLWSLDPASMDVNRLESNVPNPFSLEGFPQEEFPLLQLEYRVKDQQNRTAYPLEYWRIFHDLLPDFTFSKYSETTYQLPDTVQQGAPIHFRIAIENLVPIAFEDSISIDALILSAGNEVERQSLNIPPGQLNEPLDFSFETTNLTGDYQLFLAINPERMVRESNYSNNVLFHQFYIRSDRTRPSLDVVFDGIRILNGDLVSPKAEIYIQLEDDNPYLLLNDTSLFDLQITQPDGSSYPINFDGIQAVFNPATSSNENDASIRIYGNFEQDGEYQMTLNAVDVTGNMAGSDPYRISFQVINKQSLSNIVNYPNPFVNATRFVYTLTGESPPSYFKIQIMTVSGRIVRELTQDDLGPMRIGTHKMDYEYDGTDQYGDRLANGVYLYRVIAKDHSGKDIDLFSNSELDKYFKRGWGKMVILR